MTGSGNSYSVCTTSLMIKNDYYLIDVFRARLCYPDLRRKVANLAARYGADTVLIEDAGPGTRLLQDLQRDTPVGMNRPIGVKPDDSKPDRMASQSAKFHLPQQAEWLDSFLLEVLGFQHARHDDQVDSVSQFLKWAFLQALHDSVDIGGLISVGGTRPHYPYRPIQSC